MKNQSILKQAYQKQQQTTLRQPKKIPAQRSNVLFFLKWLLIGGSTSGIPLAVFVVLYIRKKESVPVESTTSGLATTTASALSLRWNSTGTVIAGQTGVFGVASSLLSAPYGIALDSTDSLYIADGGNDRVQKYLSGGVSGTTVAGQANATFGMTSAQLHAPTNIAVDSNNNLYVADYDNHRVQFWSNGASTGVTIAGTGVSGSATNQLNNPGGVARDPGSGTLYIADSGNDRIMSYASGALFGVVVAGGNGQGSNVNQLYAPYGVQYDLGSNSLFISNYGCHTVVRWILGATSWTLVAGTNGVAGTSSTSLNYPSGIYLDSMDNVYVTDTLNHRIQLFLPGQQNGTTIAGSTGIAGSNMSLLNTPLGVCLDSQMNLYVSDTVNSRVLIFIRY